jgi:IS605 OrfB family transposase
MEVCRTVKVKLEVSSDDADLLRATIQQFLDAANYVVDAARDEDWVETRRTALHEQTYSEVRERTDLHSNHVQSARDRAVDAIKGVVGKWKNGKYASLPTFTTPSCEYNRRNATFYDDHATLSTVDGRVTVGYVLPDESRDTPHSRYLLSDDYEPTGATLHYRDGSFYLHVRTKADVDDSEPPEDGTVLGVDLGIENIAVTSTGRFWSGDELRHWRTEYAERIRSLQECGTRWAHENIQSVGQTETGRFEQYLHRIASEILSEAVDNGCSYIAFENLQNIRDRMPNEREFHEWAFRRLYQYVEYKAEPYGISVEQVEPQYTSQRCSSCGYEDEDNRRGERFCCRSCDYENHADYNAAKNIGLRLLRAQNGDEGGAPVGVRLNSGMLNANGVVPLPESVRAGVHAECHDSVP